MSFTLYDPDGREYVASSPRERVNLLASGYSETKPFVPAEHSVEEVQAHLDAHPEQAPAVVASEARTKGRKTITGED